MLEMGEKNSHTPPTYSQPDHKLKLFWVTTLREATKKNGKIKEKVLLFVDFNDIPNAKIKENIMPGAIPKRWRNWKHIVSIGSDKSLAVFLIRLVGAVVHAVAPVGHVHTRPDHGKHHEDEDEQVWEVHARPVAAGELLLRGPDQLKQGRVGGRKRAGLGDIVDRCPVVRDDQQRVQFAIRGGEELFVIFIVRFPQGRIIVVPGERIVLKFGKKD